MGMKGRYKIGLRINYSYLHIYRNRSGEYLIDVSCL